MNQKILQAEKISKNFGGTKALDEVDFELIKGEVHALLGQNGAGKSTLSRIISGDIRKDSGKIFIDNLEINIRNCIDARKLGISMIYQELRLIPYMTVAENIFLNQYEKNSAGLISWRKLIFNAETLMSKWNIFLDPNSIVGTLPIAQQQLVEILKSLSLSAKIIIMDEPTSSLGYNEVQGLFKLINYLKTRNVAIIYISHILEEVFKITDRITIFRDGKNCGTYITREIKPNKVVEIMLNEKKAKTDFAVIKTEVKKEIVLKIENLKTKKVLTGINLNLFKNEILGITGLLGSGKTELANCIFGLDKFDSGAIIMEGKLLKIKSPVDAIKRGIGLIPEDRKKNGIFSILTLRDNLTFLMLRYLKKFGIINIRSQNRLAKEFAEKLNIKYGSLNQTANGLSGGNQQKIILGRWLSIKPKILLADEPTRGIDVGTKKEIYQLFKKIASTGTSIIVFSEEIEEILTLSDRVLVISKGSISEEYVADKITKHDLLLSITGLEGYEE